MKMKIPDLDLDLVRCFLTVAECRGFTAASVNLNSSQSAVSLKVRRLEALLGSIEAGMTGDLLAGMERGRFDLVLRAAGHGSGLEVNEERLPPREKVAWVRAAASTIDLAGDPLPLVLFPPPCGYRRGALERLGEAGRTWRFVYTGTSMQSIQAAVQADIGIGVFDRKSVCPGLKIIPPEAGLPPLPDLEISLYRHRAASTASIHSLGAFITRTLSAGRTVRGGFIE